MISISKYLNRGATQSAARTDDDPAHVAWRLSSSILDSVIRHVLNGKNSEALREQMVALKSTIDPDWNVAAALIAETSFSRILAQYSATSGQASVNQTVEMQHIFATLNQALIVLSEGKEQSVSRLSQIQHSLERTSKMQDILALKSSLLDAVEFVKVESLRTSEATNRELGKLEAEVSHAREYLSESKDVFAGRPEAVARISEQLRDAGSSKSLSVIAYSLERLQAIVNRYGSAIAGELVYRLIRERLQPFAQASATYRWTPSALVAVFQRDGELEALRTQVNNLNRSPLVHRVTLGNRTAVLTITPAHLVAEGAEGAHEKLIESVDRFAGFVPSQSARQ